MASLVSTLVNVGMPARQAELLGETGSTGIAAAGTTQVGATPLSATVNEITSATAGVNDSVRLDSIAAAKNIVVFVRNSTLAPLKVFPATGESINALAANASQTVNAASGTWFAAVSTTKWVTT
mgnify:FL=1